jgi:hypothetical protein
MSDSFLRQDEVSAKTGQLHKPRHAIDEQAFDVEHFVPHRSVWKVAVGGHDETDAIGFNVYL